MTTFRRVVASSPRHLFVDFLAMMLFDRVDCFSELLDDVCDDAGLVLIVDLEGNAAHISAARDATLRAPAARVVGFYDDFGPATAKRAFELGAQSLFSTHDDVDRIMSRILGPSTYQIAQPTGSREEARRLLADLTRRELEVASMIALGNSDAEVAEALGIEVNTVRSHLRTSYRKLGVQSRVVLGRLFREGWSS